MFAAAASAALLVALAIWAWWVVERDIARLGWQLTRASTICADAQRRAEAQRRLARAQRVTEDAVDLTNATVRAVHQNIARIPFTLLGANPSTQDQARRAQRIHDTTSEVVYGSIALINRRLGKEIRRGLQVTPTAGKAPDDAGPDDR